MTFQTPDEIASEIATAAKLGFRRATSTHNTLTIMFVRDTRWRCFYYRNVIRLNPNDGSIYCEWIDARGNFYTSFEIPCTRYDTIYVGSSWRSIDLQMDKFEARSCDRRKVDVAQLGYPKLTELLEKVKSFAA